MSMDTEMRNKWMDDVLQENAELRLALSMAQAELKEVENNSVRLLSTPCIECGVKDLLLAKAEEEIKKLNRYIGSMG